MKSEVKILIFILLVILLLLISKSAFSQGWIQLNSGTTSNLSLIQFLDANTGFAASPLLRTTNGGTNWTTISTPATPTGIFFLDINNGYFSTGNYSGGGTIYKTTNGGVIWTNLNLSSYYLTQSIYFLNKDTGYCAGISAEIKIYKTINGGSSWNNIGNFGIINDWYSVMDLFFVNPNEGYMRIHHYQQLNWPPTDDEQILHSINGGQGWGVYLSIPPAVSETSFFIGMSIPQSLSGFVIKGPESGIDTIFHYDGTYSFQGNCYFNSVYCPDPAHAWAVGNSGVIYATYNSGTSWVSQSSSVSVRLNKPYFVNGQTGYVVGNNGTILKTNTGGEEPHSVSGTVRYQDNNQPVPSGYVKALIYDQQTHNIITVDSTGIQSNGTYMLIHCPPVPLDIMAFQDDEEDNHFVPTYYVSTIYWENATEVTADTNLTGIDIGVYRINNTANNMHIGGGVYSSGSEDLAGLKDAIVYAKIGNVFKGYSISGNTGAYRIDSLSPGTYELICNRMGYYSSVRPYQLTTFSVDTIDFVLSILLVSVEPNGQNMPEKYWLSQNYPNPFNPQTKIKFGLPEQSFTKLTIYDVLGREVGVLVNEDLKAGEYDVTWDASRLSSGIYFYRLEAGDYEETKKMVLIK